MKKLQVSLKEAVDLAAEGFEIVCYVLVEPVRAKRAPGKRGSGKAPRRPAIPWDARVSISLDGVVPEHGRLGIGWKAVKEKMELGKDYSRREVEDWACAAVPALKNFTAEMIHRYKCLRVLEDA